MTIAIVDDSPNQRTLTEHLLRQGGIEDPIVQFESAEDLYRSLKLDDPEHHSEINLILLDILMPKVNGIEACGRIKSTPHLADIPVIMVTGVSDIHNLEMAFEAKAMDYIVKPVKKIDLLARTRSLLKLKFEIDQRKARERELLEVTEELRKANDLLEEISRTDALTEISNRRHFEEFFNWEWKRAERTHEPISVILIDIDHFKPYNDTYGHQRGDDCLRAVAGVLKSNLRRSQDILARYGGEEFVAVLPDTDESGVRQFAEKLRRAVQEMNQEHEGSPQKKVVTVSLGSATAVPESGLEAASLVKRADKALYLAKEQGRNRSVWA